jgi:hypothetical protein
MGWQLFRDRDHGVVDRVDDPAQTRANDDAIFWASPVGRAARARLRGDRFFQIELDDSTIEAYAEAGAALGGGGRRARRTCDLLGQIEELGWRLEHASFWRVDPNDGPIPYDDSSSGGGTVPDHVRGVYLFHSAPCEEPDGSSSSESTNGVSHPPAHRRDVGSQPA